MTTTIKNFHNYTITKYGVVTNITTGKVKKVWLAKPGYYYLDLYNCGEVRKVSLHRLLATTFLPNPHNKRTVNHIDGNKLNNSLSNLEWATDSENLQHAYDTGLRPDCRSTSDDDYAVIFSRFMNGESLTTIVKDYGVKLPVISIYMKDYLERKGLTSEFEGERIRQFLITSKVNGINRRVPIILEMLDITTGKVINTFSSVTEAKNYLKVKSCGPISNVIAGRQKTAYGYKWEKL